MDHLSLEELCMFWIVEFSEYLFLVQSLLTELYLSTYPVKQDLTLEYIWNAMHKINYRQLQWADQATLMVATSPPIHFLIYIFHFLFYSRMLLFSPCPQQHCHCHPEILCLNVYNTYYFKPLGKSYPS